MLTSENDVLSFGKWKNKKLSVLKNVDPSYILWLWRSTEVFEVNNETKQLIAECIVLRGKKDEDWQRNHRKLAFANKIKVSKVGDGYTDYEYHERWF